MTFDTETTQLTLANAQRLLLDSRNSQGHWTGELSSSALSTATAVCAFAVYDRTASSDDDSAERSTIDFVRAGLAWLIKHQNDDGGWGDTIESPSNISTTILCWAAIGSTRQRDARVTAAVDRAEKWICEYAGGLSTSHLAKAISTIYGADKTFAVPILTMCAVAGRFGNGRKAWANISTLPFELAACPHQIFRWLGLDVVSYALPALIAIGQARHFHRPTRNPLARMLRAMTRTKTLRILCAIQPKSGGFLEAAPLTSFVVMSLISIGMHDHQVVRDGLVFLRNSVRDDGSWPIDSNLATWVTTLSINALAGKDGPPGAWSDSEQETLRTWLAEQQTDLEHPYTHAAPGGWAWTDLPGGVPDADDTAGALLALHNLAPNSEFTHHPHETMRQVSARGVRWLVDLQNKNGGIPTFCRGWGKLPFDQSCPDLTAHALRAWTAWHDELPKSLRGRVEHAALKAVKYLLDTQDEHGAWLPLWFGNQHADNQRNPVYGTSRVLRVDRLPCSDTSLNDRWTRARSRAVRWMLCAQNSDGGWGGDSGIISSIEETALAVDALAFFLHDVRPSSTIGNGENSIASAIKAGCRYLTERTKEGTMFEPAPIGLYFAKLWYTERLYPLIFTVSALQQAMRAAGLSPRGLPD